MKRAASILLLTILLFNWIGYRFVSHYFENKLDIAFESSIDKQDYDEESLVELRVPLNMPYTLSNTGFERYYGEITLDGVHHKYVKRKIENGELVLLCLPDENKTRLLDAKNEFFKLVNDLDHSAQAKDKKSASSFKSITTEYKEENNSWAVIAISFGSIQHIASYERYSSPGYLSITLQPPRI